MPKEKSELLTIVGIITLLGYVGVFTQLIVHLLFGSEYVKIFMNREGRYLFLMTVLYGIIYYLERDSSSGSQK